MHASAARRALWDFVINGDVRIIEHWADEHEYESKKCMAEPVTALIRSAGIRGDVTEQDLDMGEREKDECIGQWREEVRDEGAVAYRNNIGRMWDDIAHQMLEKK
jgi:hypothetical protein